MTRSCCSPAFGELDGTIQTYPWDFGDGTTASGAGARTTHRYEQAATYAVKGDRHRQRRRHGQQRQTVAPITLNAGGYAQDGLEKKRSCPGAAPGGTSIDVYRNGAKIATGGNRLHRQHQQNGVGHLHLQGLRARVRKLLEPGDGELLMPRDLRLGRTF